LYGTTKSKIHKYKSICGTPKKILKEERWERKAKSDSFELVVVPNLLYGSET
jgi:hypothetical protein